MRSEGARGHWEDTRAALLHVAPFSPAGPLLGWLSAWGAAVVAAASLQSAGVDLGLGLGIAGTGPSNDFEAGFWLAVIQCGAFVVGGYAAARVARRNGVRHALLAWVVAMAATGADAIVGLIRDRPQVIVDLWLPYWHETGLGAGGDTVVALGIFALAALGGALVGGVLGQGVNLAARKRAEHDLKPVVETAVASSSATPSETTDIEDTGGGDRPVVPGTRSADPTGSGDDEAQSGASPGPHRSNVPTEHGFDLTRDDPPRH